MGATLDLTARELPCAPQARPRRCALRAWAVGVLTAWAWAVAAASASSPPHPLAVRAEAVVADADVVYRTRISLPCRRSTWDALVDRPALVGALWQAYGYGPAYRVSEHGDTVHVVDPTGLVGDVYLLESSSNRRRWLALGQIDHWAVPFLNTGSAVFDLALEEGQDPVTGQLTVFVQAGSTAAGFVLRLGEPILRRHVANRIDLNLADVATLLAALEATPQQVRQQVGPDVSRILDAALGTDAAPAAGP